MTKQRLTICSPGTTIEDKHEVRLKKTKSSTMWGTLQDIFAAQGVKLNTVVIHASLKILPIEAGRVILSNRSHLSRVDRRRSCRRSGCWVSELSSHSAGRLERGYEPQWLRTVLRSRLQHADYPQWGRTHVANTGLKSIWSVLRFEKMRTG